MVEELHIDWSQDLGLLEEYKLEAVEELRIDWSQDLGLLEEYKLEVVEELHIDWSQDLGLLEEYKLEAGLHLVAPLIAVVAVALHLVRRCFTLWLR